MDSYFGILAGLGGLTAGIGFAYSQFRVGAGQAKDDLIKTLKETAIVEREKAERLAAEKITLINSHQGQINELNLKIGKLQGTAEANEKKMNEYLTILQGKDPAQMDFIATVLAEIKKNQEVQPAAQKYMQDSITILGEIRTFMQNLNDKAEHSDKFIRKVETSTAKESGKALRVD